MNALQQRAEVVAGFAAALIGGIEAVTDQIEKYAGHVLRHHLDRGEGGVEVALQGDVEILILGAGAVTGQVQGLFDRGLGPRSVNHRCRRANAAVGLSVVLSAPSYSPDAISHLWLKNLRTVPLRLDGCPGG